LHQRIVDLEKTNHRLTESLDKLETRVNRNSSKSSRPPSSDPPYKKKSKDRPAGKKPGGKEGTRITANKS